MDGNTIHIVFFETHIEEFWQKAIDLLTIICKICEICLCSYPEIEVNFVSEFANKQFILCT